MDKDLDLSFILNELGEERENYFNAIAPPIAQTSNFAFKTVSDFRNGLANEYDSWLYSRGNNPTVNILRKKLAALDGAEDALVFGSGIASIAVPLLALLKQGDHVVSVARPYSWTIKLFEKLLPKFGITTTFVVVRAWKILKRPPRQTLVSFIWSPPIPSPTNCRILLRWLPSRNERVFSR